MASKKVVITEDGMALVVNLDCKEDALQFYKSILNAKPGDTVPAPIRLMADDMKTIADVANAVRRSSA